jgi:hypothetical protein
MLKLESKERISWVDIFAHPLFAHELEVKTLINPDVDISYEESK